MSKEDMQIRTDDEVEVQQLREAISKAAARISSAEVLRRVYKILLRALQ